MTVASEDRESAHGLERGRSLRVFCGSKVGLMGLLADAVLSAGGRVTGVIPQGLEVREVAHTGSSEDET